MSNFIDEYTIVVQINPGRDNPIVAFVPEFNNDPGIEAKTLEEAVFPQLEKIKRIILSTLLSRRAS